MRRAPAPAITAKMYRHFAIMTLAFTGLIAMFADGENRQAVAQEVAAEPQEAGTQVSDASEAPLQVAEQDSGTWGDELAFGEPMSTGPSSGGSWAPSFARTPSGPVSGGLSSVEDSRLGSGDSSGAPAVTREQLAAAEAASRRRSGSAGLE